MSDNSNNSVVIYSYQKVWKIDKKLYSFSNIRLPVPVDPMDLAAYGLGVLIMLAVGKIIPPFQQVSWIVRYLIFPYLLAKAFFKIKPDGKNLFKYLIGCLRYLFMVRGTFMQTFKRRSRRAGTVRLSWQCSQGKPQ